MIIDGNLAEAMERAIVTRLERSAIEEGHFSGYVVDATDHFVLFLVVSDQIRFDGFSVLRMCDLTSIEVPAPNADFINQALRIRGEEVQAAPSVDLASFPTVLTSASREYPLVTIHAEEADPDVCYIGHLVSVDDKRIVLLEIDSHAEWDDEPTEYQLADITRVDFGAQYEDALYQVGGEPPNVEQDD